jgi:MFS family permease
MLGFAFAPLVSGPGSDRYGRRPVVVFACTLFIIAGIGCGVVICNSAVPYLERTTSRPAYQFAVAANMPRK